VNAGKVKPRLSRQYGSK